MIQFIKTLRYPLEREGADTFEYLCGVVAQSIDPPSLEPSSLVIERGILLHSPLRRVTECLKTDDRVRIVPLSELREIPFRMGVVCSRDEWLAEKSIAVRRGFKRAFIRDELLIKRGRIFEEIKSVLSLCKGGARNGKMTVVSHSFRMKLIEAYIKTDRKIVEEPDLINGYLIDDQKTYQFGQGFCIRKDEI